MPSLPLLLVLTLALGACSTSQPRSDVPVRVDSLQAESGPMEGDGEEELAANRQRWVTEGPADYRLTYSRVCRCPPEDRGPFGVTVEDSTVTGVMYLGEGGPTERKPADGFYTVEDFYDLLAEAYERDAAEVRVSYDADTGQPLDIYIDYDTGIADEEVSFTAEPARPLDG